MRIERHRQEELQAIIDLLPEIGGTPGASDIVRAVVTTAIPSGSIGSPSTSGKATIYLWDSQTATSSISTDSSQIDVRICNDHSLSASVSTGKTIKAAFIDGDYWLIAADC